MKLASYVATLAATRGVMEEFVNPKYADATRTAFKKPTRLECMMQDYAKVRVMRAGLPNAWAPAPVWGERGRRGWYSCCLHRGFRVEVRRLSLSLF